ncbi:MAG: translation factor [Zetaproteobacteria bacterium]|nr:MAG: translation factor [Zetaproteobacteria bacterium]
MIAHETSTLPGAAVCPDARGLARLQSFKGRKGPFLLLARDRATALHWARWIPSLLRRMARSQWPGSTTLVFPGRPGLPPACYRRGQLAVRVDASPMVRLLAREAGGLVLSSSLNRRGGVTKCPERQSMWRWRRYFGGWMSDGASSGRASRMLRIGSRCCERIRP